MRAVDPDQFAPYVGEIKSENLGVIPGLAWIPVSSLRIDPSYQREVLRRGARNIGLIAREFDWSLFGIVVVANIGDGLFAIVDGQHRTIAAALRKIEEVPCIIIEAAPNKQAQAFAAINGAITAISALAIHAAEVVAGDEDAIELRYACERAKVTICKYPVPANMMKAGETIAIGALRDTLKSYGSAHLTLVLRCIVLGARQRPGLIKANIIKALAHVLDAEKTFVESPSRLLEAMSTYDFATELNEAEIDGKKHKRGTQTSLSMRLFNYLDKELGS